MKKLLYSECIFLMNKDFRRVKEDEANEQHRSIIEALRAVAPEWTFEQVNFVAGRRGAVVEDVFYNKLEKLDVQAGKRDNELFELVIEDIFHYCTTPPCHKIDLFKRPFRGSRSKRLDNASVLLVSLIFLYPPKILISVRQGKGTAAEERRRRGKA